MEPKTENFLLSYRLAREEDFEAVYHLYMDETSNPFLTYDLMPESVFHNIFHSILPGNTLSVVEANRKIIGSYRLLPKTDRQAHILYLGGFVVDSKLTGKGIGSKILGHIIQVTRNQLKTRLELTVDCENSPAVNLYKKLGFVIEGRIRNSYKRLPENKYFDEYLMALLLDEMC